MTTNSPVPQALINLIEPLVAESGLEIYDLERAGAIVRVIVDIPAERKVPAVEVAVPDPDPDGSDAAGEPAAADGPAVVGVDIGSIAKLTRAISRAIDEHDPIPGQFTLEVTSPGLERNLRTPLHFTRAIGEKVSVKTVRSYEGERRINGLLVAIDDDGIILTTDEASAAEVAPGDPATTLRIDHRDIDKARTLYEWGAQPKPGSKKSSNPSSKKQSTKKSSPKKAKAS